MVKKTNNQNEITRKEGLDLLRFVCAAMVVCIHIGFPGHIGQAMIWMCRIAVPCFFIISGYFFNKETFRLRKVLRKLLPWFLAGALCYLVKSIVIAPETLAEIFSLRSLFLLVIFDHPRWAEHLWYLLAMCYTYIIVAATARWELRKWAPWAIFVLFMLNLLAGEFSAMLFGEAYPEYYARNYLFFALPFFLTGRLVREKEIWLDTLGKKLLCAGIGLTGLAVSLLEYVITRQKTDFTIGFFFMSTSVFFFAKQYAFLPKWLRWVAAAGRRYTLLIYIMHPLIGIGLKKVAETLSFGAYPYIATPLVFAISLMCAMAWQYLVDTVKKTEKYVEVKENG